MNPRPDRAAASPVGALPRVVALVLLGVLLAACAGDGAAPPSGPTPSDQTATAPATSPTTSGPTPTDPPTPTPTAAPTTPAAPAVPDPARMMDTIRALAGEIGPREATSEAYVRAAALIEQQLRGLGYAVRRQPVPVPAGESWGVPVPAGTSSNVIAEPPGFERTQPHLLIGAHLDTVPQSPGAEDNGSGVAVLLEVARLASVTPTRVPVVFVAFGAEEPRGPGDALHHFGSRAYVAAMGEAERAALVGMISLDRVGIGDVVRVCTGGRGPDGFARQVVEVARGLGIRSQLCENRGSDHWSFEKADLPAARLRGRGFPEYHTPQDRPGVVNPDQLLRIARVTWATMITVP